MIIVGYIVAASLVVYVACEWFSRWLGDLRDIYTMGEPDERAPYSIKYPNPPLTPAELARADEEAEEICTWWCER